MINKLLILCFAVLILLPGLASAGNELDEQYVKKILVSFASRSTPKSVLCGLSYSIKDMDKLEKTLENLFHQLEEDYTRHGLLVRANCLVTINRLKMPHNSNALVLARNTLDRLYPEVNKLKEIDFKRQIFSDGYFRVLNLCLQITKYWGDESDFHRVFIYLDIEHLPRCYARDFFNVASILDDGKYFDQIKRMYDDREGLLKPNYEHYLKKVDLVRNYSKEKLRKIIEEEFIPYGGILLSDMVDILSLDWEFSLETIIAGDMTPMDRDFALMAIESKTFLFINAYDKLKSRGVRVDPKFDSKFEQNRELDWTWRQNIPWIDDVVLEERVSKLSNLQRKRYDGFVRAVFGDQPNGKPTIPNSRKDYNNGTPTPGSAW